MRSFLRHTPWAPTVPLPALLNTSALRFVSSSSDGSSSRSNRHAASPGVQEVQSAFSVLGLPSSATFVEVRKRFIVLAKENHPDVVCPFAAAERQRTDHQQQPLPVGSSCCSHSGETIQRPGEAQATQKMIAINEAYHTLHVAHRAGVLNAGAAAHANPDCNSGGASPRRSAEHASASRARDTDGADRQRHQHSRTDRKPHQQSAAGGDAANGEHGQEYYHYRRRENASSDFSRDSTSTSSTARPSSSSSTSSSTSRGAPFIRSDSSRRSLRFLYNESTPVIRNPFVELKEDEAPNFSGYYYERTYAQVVAGKTITTTFDAESKRFTLVFRADPMMDATVTRIRIHFDLHYPQGIAVEVSCSAPVPKGKLSWKQVGKDCVEVSHDRVAIGLARLTVTVKIEPICLVRQS